MREIDTHLWGVDLVSVIFRSAFAHDTQTPHLRLHDMRGYQLQVGVTFGVSAG